VRHINEIIVHCTATRPEWAANESNLWQVAEVRRWHVEDRNFSDIGYHYLIHRNGYVSDGRPIGRAGAHVKGHNANSIGISLFGGFGGATTDQFEDHFTPEQDKALRKLIAKLQEQYPTIEKVSGHSEYAAKACPCFDVSEWLADEPALSHPDPVEQKPTGLAALLTALIALVQSFLNRR
jgi:N-acetylmuramoyl-L-alanine amidase